jgi:hypothetical protein
MTQQLGPKQEAWLQALESGKYRQTRQVLHDGEGYCCLGVACVVEGVKPRQSTDGETFWFEDDFASAPDSVAQALKLRGTDGERRDDSVEWMLTRLNDYGKTFAEIAAIIREEPEQYFTGAA